MITNIRKVRKEPKFYQNWEDDNHCLQAAVMMVLNSLYGETLWDEVNRITKYEDRLYSWVPPAVVALAERIPGTKLISAMDYGKFAERGEEYFKEYNTATPQWFELQRQHASPGFQKEQRDAHMLIQQNLAEQRRITKTDVESLLQDNLLITLVDAGKLDKENWSAGHWVVMYAEDANNFAIHDPGLPAKKAWRVDKNQFMEAFQNELIVIPATR